MIKRVIILIGIWLLWGCQDVERPEKPDNLIPQEKMVDILVDTYLGAAAQSVAIREVRQNGIKLDSFLYAKHQVDSTQFVQSNAYYSSQLDTYIEITEAVEQKLNAMKVVADSVYIAERDSIQNRGRRNTPPQNTNESEEPTEKNVQLIQSVESDDS
ncbi:DUF4296 domain-containing protein [Altibacter sp. HG106]|uniref:DUF4296 domain-containing protein n=1 Tax=Altibacter sp. HG106 TaxID=3023937 RepID=UPI00234FB7C9|nr:DUF4296 domain-containing protein [Altibacter sp. HG106]MDC7995261.1 DUF4296 domain-containing protein [Altibacter sp. HG106]